MAVTLDDIRAAAGLLEGQVVRTPSGREFRFEIDPCIPQAWPACSITWRVGETRYDIEVVNPERRSRGVAEALLDGNAVDPSAVPLLNDGGRHELKVVLGETKEMLTTSLSPMELARRAFDPYDLLAVPGMTNISGFSAEQGQRAFASEDGTFRLLFVQARPASAVTS